MRTRILIKACVPALGCLLLLCGCAVVPPPTPLERDYGLSHRLAIYGQIANPAAGESRRAAEDPMREVPSGSGVTMPIQEKNQPECQGKPEK